MTVNIMGVDPGKTVGIATYLDGRFSSLELPRDDALPWIEGFLSVTRCFVAVERFFKGQGRGPKRTIETDALEVIGEIEGLRRRLGFIAELQTPADAKAVCPDRWLQKMKWFNSGHPHANDAGRHVKLVLMRRFKDEFRQVLLGKTLRLMEEEEHAHRGT